MWAYRLELATIKGVLRWYFRSRAYGVDRVPRTGPLLLAANHASFLDPWFVGHLFPRAPMHNLMNERWYRRSALWRRFFDAHGVIPIIKNNPAATVLGVVRALQAGGVVCLFPEGRVTQDGRFNRARVGIGWMAALSGAPVVPCGLRGSFEALSRHHKFPRRHPVELRIGRPLSFPGGPVHEPEPAAVREFVGEVAGAISELAGRGEERHLLMPAEQTRDLRPALRVAANDGERTAGRTATSGV